MVKSESRWPVWAVVNSAEARSDASVEDRLGWSSGDLVVGDLEFGSGEGEELV